MVVPNGTKNHPIFDFLWRQMMREVYYVQVYQRDLGLGISGRDETDNEKKEWSRNKMKSVEEKTRSMIGKS